MAEMDSAGLERDRVGTDPGKVRSVARATPSHRRHSSERAVTMPRTTDAKRRVGARVNAKAHFAMSASDAKRTYGNPWNLRFASGTLESVHEDDSGKRVSVFVTVMWDLPAGRKLGRVNVRSIAAGEAPETIGAAARQSPPAAGQAGDADVEQDGGRRHRDFAAYNVSGSPAPPDRADNLVDAATSMAHGVLWEEEDVLQPVGGDVPRRLWTLQTAAGDTIFESGDSGSAVPPRRRCDYFMAVFPPDQLARMVELTNDKLATNKRPQLTTGGLLKFFGVLTLGTRHEFGHRADLWEIEAGSPLLRRRRLARRLGCPGSGLTPSDRR
jgi:Transposase IS4